MNPHSSFNDELELRPGDLAVCDWCKQEYIVTSEMLDEPDAADEAWEIHHALPTCPYCFERFMQALGLHF